MRILQVVSYYPPHRTGLSLYVERVAEALARRGHRVTVLTSRYARQLPRDEVRHGVRIVRLPSVARISRGQITPGFPLTLDRLLREHDVVNAHTPMLETPLVAALARLRGRRFVITHHGDLVLPPNRAINRVIEATVGAFFHLAARWADALIAYTQDYAHASRYLRPHLGRVIPIYPPIAIPPADPAGVAALRGRLAPDGGPLIGYAGRFVEEKRPDVLLAAFPHLLPRWPTARLAFAGQYLMPYERYYERCEPLLAPHRDRITFLGLLDDPQDLADFYAACDVIALPSATECFGLVQVEAMLSGTPVVATDIPGARVPVRVTGMGRLVTMGEPLELAEAIALTIERGHEYRRERHEVESEFDLTRTIAAYERVLVG